MKCIVELFGDDRNGRKMIAWGGASAMWTQDACVTQNVGKLPKLFVRAFTLHADLLYLFPPC